MLGKDTKLQIIDELNSKCMNLAIELLKNGLGIFPFSVQMTMDNTRKHQRSSWEGFDTRNAIIQGGMDIWRRLVKVIMWVLWKARNTRIFEEDEPQREVHNMIFDVQEILYSWSRGV